MMVFVLTILTNMLITFIFLNLYSRYLAKELKKIEDRVLVYLQLKTMLQKEPINFQIDSEKFKHLTDEAIHDTSQVTQ